MSASALCPRLTPLCRYLDSLTSRIDMGVLEQVLIENQITIEDVRNACVFDDQRYQRNKIACSDWYDLLVICWRPTQATAIHDHTASSCGFKILTGTATEVIYEKTGNKNSSTDYVTPIRKRSYSAGELCLAEDLDIHRISNDTSEDLVTLHIYSPPLQMKFYEAEPALDPLGARTSDTELGRILSGRR